LKRATLEVELQGTRLVARLVPPTDVRRTRSIVAVIAAEREIDDALVDRLARDIAGVLNRGTRWADADRASGELLRRKGAALFDALLPAPIKAALRAVAGAGEPAELVVTASRSLGQVPWELLHTGFGFLGMALALGRVEPGATTTPQRAERARTMLVVADPRGDLIGSYYEGLTLRDELGADPGRLRVDLRSSEVGRGDVLELLRDYDLVHYAGHAEPITREPDAPRGWWLRDGVLGPDVIRELAGGARFPRLVFVNACRSARAEGAAAGVSLAEAFVHAGAEHVIGTVWDVPDEPASGFAIQFHAALVSGATVGEAARRARLWVAARYGAGAIYWAAWVVHGDPGVALFDPAARDRGTADVREPAAEELPALAARVRGMASAAIPEVASLDERRRARWLEALRRGAVVACVAILAVIVGLLQARGRTRDDAMVRASTAADFGPIERFAAAPLAAPLAPPAEGSASLGEAAPLALEVVSASGPARTLAPDAPFRVRWSAPDDGWVTVWRVDAAGHGHHLGPVLAPAFAGAVVDLPGAGGWYSPRGLANSGPAEVASPDGAAARFMIAWRRDAPADAGELVDELRALADGAGDPGVERVREGLEDRFDRVVVIEVQQSVGATEGVFR